MTQPESHEQWLQAQVQRANAALEHADADQPNPATNMED